MYYCAAILLYYCTTVRLYCYNECTTVLLYYCTTVLLCGYTAMMYYSILYTCFCHYICNNTIITIMKAIVPQDTRIMRSVQPSFFFIFIFYFYFSFLFYFLFILFCIFFCQTGAGVRAAGHAH